MASFTTKAVNLMALSGAQLLSGLDTKHPQKVFVCIPCEDNEISAVQGRDGKPMANIPLALWPMRNRDAYLQKVNQSRMAAGDQPLTLDNTPTHTLQLNHSNEWVKATIKRFGADRMKAACLAKQSPDYAKQIENDDPLDENGKLFKAIRTLLNVTIARMYSHNPQPRTDIPAQAGTVAQGVSGYTAPAEASNDYYNSEEYANPETEDLPF